MAIGSTMAALASHDQGWVTCAGEGGTDELSITPTPGGRVVMTRLAGGYADAVRFLSAAGRVGADPVAGDAALEPFLEAVRGDWGLPVAGVPAGVRHQVLAHLNGHLIAPIMFGLTRANRPPGGNAAQVLARQGWMRRDDGADRLTAAGEMAVMLARQYRYPMVYLPLLRSVPGLIFGDPPAPTADGDDETHLDRDLDIRFSGEVFAATCRAPFLDVALPLFDREPVAAQPVLVVDSGCGDGTLLETLYGAVRTQTGRRHDRLRAPGRRRRPRQPDGSKPGRDVPGLAAAGALARLDRDRGVLGPCGHRGRPDRADARHRLGRHARLLVPVPGRTRGVRLGRPVRRLHQLRSPRARRQRARAHPAHHRPLRHGRTRDGPGEQLTPLAWLLAALHPAWCDARVG
jgi:hypothetical protein